MYTLLNDKLLIICVNQVQPHVHKGATTSILDSLYINEKQGRIQRRGHDVVRHPIGKSPVAIGFIKSAGIITLIK